MTGFQSSFLSVSHISHLVITPSLRKVQLEQYHPPFPTLKAEAEGGEGVGASERLDEGFSSFLSPLPPSLARSFPPFPLSFPPEAAGAEATVGDGVFFPAAFPPPTTAAVEGVTGTGAGDGVAIGAAVAGGLVALTFRTCEAAEAAAAVLAGVEGRILMVCPLLVVMDVVSVDSEGTVDTFPLAPPPLASLERVVEGLVGEVEGGVLTAAATAVEADGVDELGVLTDLQTLESSTEAGMEGGKSHPPSTSLRRSSPLSVRLLPPSALSVSSSPTLPALALSLLFLLSPSLSLPSNKLPCAVPLPYCNMGVNTAEVACRDVF